MPEGFDKQDPAVFAALDACNMSCCETTASPSPGCDAPPPACHGIVGVRRRDDVIAGLRSRSGNVGPQPPATGEGTGKGERGRASTAGRGDPRRPRRPASPCRVTGSTSTESWTIALPAGARRTRSPRPRTPLPPPTTAGRGRNRTRGRPRGHGRWSEAGTTVQVSAGPPACPAAEAIRTRSLDRIETQVGRSATAREAFADARRALAAGRPRPRRPALVRSVASRTITGRRLARDDVGRGRDPVRASMAARQSVVGPPFPRIRATLREGDSRGLTSPSSRRTRRPRRGRLRRAPDETTFESPRPGDLPR